MRKLKKSHQFGPTFWFSALKAYQANISSKPHARLMHSLAVITFGENPPDHHWIIRDMLRDINKAALNRRARRAEQFREILEANGIGNRPPYTKEQLMAEGLTRPSNLPARKMTGAVRRGLERGRVS